MSWYNWKGNENQTGLIQVGGEEFRYGNDTKNYISTCRA
jgi:hypothetical protein